MVKCPWIDECFNSFSPQDQLYLRLHCVKLDLFIKFRKSDPILHKLFSKLDFFRFKKNKSNYPHPIKICNCHCQKGYQGHIFVTICEPQEHFYSYSSYAYKDPKTHVW